MILKLKVADPLSDADVPQFRNYLPATGKPLRRLTIFGQPKVEITRIA
jgi:hypothetical protein